MGRIRLRRGMMGGALPPFLFDSSLCTFTAGMAVRTGPSGVFAGAPIVQGDLDGSGTPDTLTFARGTQVETHWYDNFDPYQGTFAILWTPEKDRSASQTNNEYLFYLSYRDIV